MKAKTVNRASARKATSASIKKAAKTVADYRKDIPRASRKAFDRLRSCVQSAAPADAVETISYGIPALKSSKVIVWYAAFADHCSLFPTASIIAAFADELKTYRTSKGTIQFPLDRPVPVALVKKLVKARVAQVAQVAPKPRRS
jgi:uncharacterized protein YdhG (YjbR/CyaY superfamily)